MNPDPIVQRAAPVRRSRYRSLPQRPASITPTAQSLQVTPPLTPQASTDKMAPMFEEHEMAPEFYAEDDTEAPIFQNYLRAFYHFHPTTPVSSVSEESSITIPINQGDVILVHSIQPNGWADGTLLQSGARGWLPTNYCEPYDHEHIRTLLNALTYVWEFLRGFDGSDVSVLAKQDYVRGLIAGVRVLFERTGCLNRDSPLVVRHVGLRRLRKSLLGDLSAFVKSAKHLVAVCHAQGLTSEDLTRSLDDIVLKAQKAVTRAVKFLDVWTQDVHMKEVIGHQPHHLQQQQTRSLSAATGRLSTGAPMLPLTPPAEGALSTQSPTSPDAAKGPNSLLVLADYAAKDGSPTTNAGSTEVVSHPILPNGATDPTSPGAALNDPASSSSSSRRFSRTVAASTNNNNNSSRPASFVPKRGSIGYRWSTHGSRKLISPNHALASEQLGKAHDAFLGCLGAYIGLHLQSRCSIELLVTTQQSVIACQSLIAVVDEVWERDSRRSDDLDQARENMHFKLTALVQATRDIFGAAANDEQEVFLPDQGKQLVDAATLCVRGAGECVAKTRSVIERIGDFEYEPGALPASDEQPASPFPDALSPSTHDSSEPIPEEQPEQLHSREPSRASDYSYSSAGATVVQASTPARPQSYIPAPPNSIQATPEASRSTPTPSSTLTASSGSLTPQAAATSSDSVAPPRTSSLEPIPRTVSVGDLFQIDFPNPPSLDLTLPVGASSLDGKDRPGSLSNSMTDTNSTYHSSFRHSETSLASQGSTQMTSSDEADPNDTHLTASFGNLSDAGPNAAEEVDEAEAQLLTKTYAHELTFNKEGQITGGSLPALVERLTTHDSTPDAFFVNTFYLTFRLFTTPREFAQALTARFDDAGEAKEIGGPIRLRVYNVMKGWLESHWRMETDTEAFDTIISFANTKLKAYLPSASKRVLELVDKAADPKEASAAAAARKMSILGRTSTPSPTFPNYDAMASMPVVNKSQLNLLKFNSKNAAKTSILDFDALELARQLTILESRMFCSIQPEELLASEWMKKSSSKASNVRSMSTFSTDLSNLIADTVLLHEEPKKRALVLRQWIKVAKKCLELNNYDTLMAIICSLDSSMVGRLHKTWAFVPAKNMTKLVELRKIVDVSKNYAALRQAHQSQVAPCLPFVGIYLTDLTFIDVGNQGMRQLSADGPEVINFDKHVKTAKIIGDLQRFQVPYPLTPVPEIQDWIMAQIARINESGDANVTAWYRRSCLLEPREPQISRTMSVVDSAAAVEKTTTREKFEFWSNLHFPSNNKAAAAMPATATATTP